MKLIYGPVESRRFGTSLGINVLGEKKICSFDCRYCDLGATEITMSQARKSVEFPSVADVVTSLRTSLASLPPVDVITFSGNGEPTVHPEIERMVAEVLAVRDELSPRSKLIMLSNGAHLDSRKVIAAMNQLDSRVLKLDAGTEKMLKKLNAPLVRRNLSQLASDFRKLRDCTIQSLFVQGSLDNTTGAELDEWIEMIGIIRPLEVQLMTVTRTPLDPTLTAVDEDTLYSIAFRLKKRTQIEAKVFFEATRPLAKPRPA